MNQTFDTLTGVSTTYIGIDDIMSNLQYGYAKALFILSMGFLIYTLWNNFVRSPSKPIGIKNALRDTLDIEKELDSIINEDVGMEPSNKVKKVSRMIDGYMIVPALFMVYITWSYLNIVR